VGWKELGITNCFTLESSFCGSDFGKHADLHFNTNMLQSIGPAFCETIYEFSQIDSTRLKEIQEEIEAYSKNAGGSSANAAAALAAAKEQEMLGERGKQGDPDYLGVIKDDDDESNQDSDFSGDDAPPVLADGHEGDQ
jgi:hypothetical protein